MKIDLTKSSNYRLITFSAIVLTYIYCIVCSRYEYSWNPLTWSSSTGWVKPKTIQLIFVAFSFGYCIVCLSSITSVIYSNCYCSSTEHASLRRKSKDWLSWNQDNVPRLERRLLFQWVSTIKINSACWSSIKWTSSLCHWKITCSRHNIAEKLLSWH